MAGGGAKRTRVLALQLLLGPRLLGLLEPVLPELDLLLGGVGVESVLQGLAVDDTVDDARGEGRVPDDLLPFDWRWELRRGGKSSEEKKVKAGDQGREGGNGSVTPFSCDFACELTEHGVCV